MNEDNNQFSPEARKASHVKMAKDAMNLLCVQIMQQSATYLLNDIMEDQVEVDKLKAMRTKVKQFAAAIADMPDDFEFLKVQGNKLEAVNHALNVQLLDKIPDDLYTEIETLEIKDGK